MAERQTETERLAPMKAQVYKDPRPAEHFARFHARSRSRQPDPMYEFVRICTTLWGMTFFRARGYASDRVPAHGPLILAPNHFSFMDHFLVAMFTRRHVRFMAKSQLFTKPLEFVYNHGGVFPVRRGHHDEEAFVTAETILRRGGCVGMYCEGGRSRTGQLSEKAKSGIGRLALDSGATIVPVAVHGSSKVRNWKRLQFPAVSILYGEPFMIAAKPGAGRDEQQAAADEIFDHVKAIYAEMDRHGRRGIVTHLRRQRRRGG